VQTATSGRIFGSCRVTVDVASGVGVAASVEDEGGAATSTRSCSTGQGDG